MTSQETRLKKAHIALMKHPETALYSGVIMMGKSSVVDDNITAYTDGVNKKYGRKFIEALDDSELRALVLHENLHVALKHIQRFQKEFKDNPKLINMSADYVVNDVIVNVKENGFLRLPQGGLVDEKYHNWNVRDVYNDLKKQQQDNPQEFEQKFSQGNENENGQTMDEHDFANGKMSPEKEAELSKDIDRALREGGILSGRMGGKTPRVIQDLLTPKVDWRTTLKDFVMSATRGSDEYTWRKFNKRLMANDIYLPSLENESIGEVVVAIDTSASITEQDLTSFASELVSICSVSSPDRVRVLWWDTEVHGEQIFEDDYTNLHHMLKPQGFGGTYVSCVSKYIQENSINAEALIVFTDGYVEEDIDWGISIPTLWLVTENEGLKPPVGTVIKQRKGD